MPTPGPIPPAALQAAREALVTAGLMSADVPHDGPSGAPPLPRLTASSRGPRTLALEFSPRAGGTLVLEWTEHRGEDLPSFARGPRFAASYSRKPGAWDLDAPDTPGALRELGFQACRALAACQAEVSLAAPQAPTGPATPAATPDRGDDEGEPIDALVHELGEALGAELGTDRFPGSQGWALVHARPFTFWRRVADFKLAHGDRTLSFIVFPTDPNERVYARTSRLDVVYYSDDLPPSEHDALFARDGAMIDAFVAWLDARG